MVFPGRGESKSIEAQAPGPARFYKGMNEICNLDEICFSSPSDLAASFYSYSYPSSQTTTDSPPSSPITTVATITTSSPSRLSPPHHRRDYHHPITVADFSFTLGLLSVSHSILSRMRRPLHGFSTNTLPLSVSHLLHHLDIIAVASLGPGDHHDGPATSSPRRHPR